MWINITERINWLDLSWTKIVWVTYLWKTETTTTEKSIWLSDSDEKKETKKDDVTYKKVSFEITSWNFYIDDKWNEIIEIEKGYVDNDWDWKKDINEPNLENKIFKNDGNGYFSDKEGLFKIKKWSINLWKLNLKIKSWALKIKDKMSRYAKVVTLLLTSVLAYEGYRYYDNVDSSKVSSKVSKAKKYVKKKTESTLTPEIKNSFNLAKKDIAYKRKNKNKVDSEKNLYDDKEWTNYEKIVTSKQGLKLFLTDKLWYWKQVNYFLKEVKTNNLKWVKARVKKIWDDSIKLELYQNGKQIERIVYDKSDYDELVKNKKKGVIVKEKSVFVWENVKKSVPSKKTKKVVATNSVKKIEQWNFIFKSWDTITQKKNDIEKKYWKTIANNIYNKFKTIKATIPVWAVLVIQNYNTWNIKAWIFKWEEVIIKSHIISKK